MPELKTIPFNSPLSQKTIHIETSDITSLCPLTGLRDLGALKLSYSPTNALVELKSLKEYLGSFDNEDIWQEDFLSEIESTIVSAIHPTYLHLELTYHTRGGMNTKVESTYWVHSQPKIASEDSLWNMPVGILTIGDHTTPVNFIISEHSTRLADVKIAQFIVDSRSKKAKLVDGTVPCSLLIHNDTEDWKVSSALIAKGKITKTDKDYYDTVYSDFSRKYPGYLDEITEICGQEEMDKDIVLTMAIESVKYFTSEDIVKEGGA